MATFSDTSAIPVAPQQPAKGKQERSWRDYLVDSYAFLIAVFFHTLLFAMLGTYVIYEAVTERDGFDVVGVPSMDAQPTAPTATVPEMQAPSMDELEAPAGLPDMQAPSLDDASPITDVLAVNVATPDASSLVVGSRLGMSSAPKIGGGAGGTGAPGLSGGGGPPGLAGVSLFGMKATAQKVVVVFDISASMIKNGSTPENYNILEDEMVRLVNSLSPGSRFGLVAFAKGEQAYRTSLMTAGGFAQKDAIKWLQGMNPGEPLGDDGKGKAPDYKKYKGGRHWGTRADLGLERAFSMEPDVIFFVSDGEPQFKGDNLKATNEKELLALVRDWQERMNQPVTINTIAYKAGKRLKFMEQLASQNGGDYQEIK